MRARRVWGAVTLVGLLAGAPRCALETSAIDAATSPRVTLRAVTWRLAWDLRDVERRAGGWAVTTDRGYRVEVSSGALLTMSLSLRPCEMTSGRRWFASAVAFANHGKEPNPSQWAEPVLEDLGAPADVVVGERSFDARQWCGAHWLIARAPEARADAVGLRWTRMSVQLEGTWTRGGERGEFRINTPLADGALLPLMAAGGGGAPPDRARVTVRRRLARAFDGVEFRDGDDGQTAWRFVENLVRHARVEVDTPTR